MLRFLLFLLLVSPGFCSGCRLFQAAGERTSNTLNRFASSGTQRRSMLDELESDQPEYLLDSVFKKKKDNRNPEIGLQNQDQARQYFSQADQLYRQAASERDHAWAIDDRENITYG